eukprot:2473030-Rhodomonas_salina.2
MGVAVGGRARAHGQGRRDAVGLGCEASPLEPQVGGTHTRTTHATHATHTTHTYDTKHTHTTHAAGSWRVLGKGSAGLTQPGVRAARFEGALPAHPRACCEPDGRGSCLDQRAPVSALQRVQARRGLEGSSRGEGEVGGGRCLIRPAAEKGG